MDFQKVLQILKAPIERLKKARRRRLIIAGIAAAAGAVGISLSPELQNAIAVIVEGILLAL